MMGRLLLGIMIIFSLPTASALQIGLSGPVESSPTLADIDNNLSNGLEIVVGTNDDYMHAIYSNGTEMLRWRIDPTGHVFMTGMSSAAIADLDGDGIKEILIGGQKASGMGGGDNPGYVWAYYLNGTQMWRYSTVKTSIYSSPVVADIDGDGDYEVLIGSNNYKLYALYGNGSLYWSRSLGGGNVTTAAVGDVNEDGSPEIIAASSNGRVYVLGGDGAEINFMQTGGIGISSPALADIDNDDDLEIIIASTDGKVYAWHGDGTTVGGWPVQAGRVSQSSPSVGDLDGNGDLEVVVVTDHNDVYAYHGNGTLLDGFPLTHQEKLGLSSPALVDLDGDGRLEIILGTSYHFLNETTNVTINSGKVYAWYINGTLVGGFPKTTGNWIKSSPAVADIDGDGKNEIIIGSDDKNLYIWEIGAASDNHGWPMFHYNENNTRMYDAPAVRVLSPGNGTYGSYYKNPIFFNATANDVDGHITSYGWSSSIDGPLDNSSFFIANLSLGNHVITLRVEYDYGKVEEVKVDMIVVDNFPPTATILSPSNGSTFSLGENITFSGSGEDPDGEVVSYQWISGKDGVLGSGSSLTISSLSVGDHVITLEVVDNESANGTASIYLKIVKEEDQTTGAGGGGGGGGGSATSFEAWIKDVLAGQTFELDIDDEDIPYINGLSLTAKQAIYSSKLSITDLDKKPWSSMEEPDANVYRYFTVGYDKDDYVESASFKFSINKSWLKANDIDPYKFSVYRYTNSWEGLDAKILKEDGEDIYFEVTTPGFSYFSLGGANGSGYRTVKEEVEETPSSVTTALPATPKSTVAAPTPTVTPAPKPIPPEEKGGICGPTVVVLLAMLLVLVLRRRRTSS